MMILKFIELFSLLNTFAKYPTDIVQFPKQSVCLFSLFTDENGQRQHVWQTSWAIRTLFVGGIIMTHGDDLGLMLPPRLAPVQVFKKVFYCNDRTGVLNATSSVKETLQAAGIKVKVDDFDQRTPGWKYNFWKIKVCLLLIEIGPRDVSSGTVVISRRDIPGKQGKDFGISMDSSLLVAYVKGLLDEIQSCLLERATSSIHEPFFFLWEL
ncbi:unnamed protein product [Coffea canephora]|uniref:Anticodon-binding domain-containing protein n=1 Tax=Coffea canephora TaxID=49390 RepID=A0A068U8Q7_COFCA|nr:unnamed protein product [Coffea canephora]